MSIETISQRAVWGANRKGPLVDLALNNSQAKVNPMQAMREILKNRKTLDRLSDMAKLINRSPWINSGFGVYFATVANMKTTYGPRVIPTVNRAYEADWQAPVELGSGVGTIEPWEGSQKLLELGIKNPALITQYDSPGGTYPSRWAAATMINEKIEPGKALENPIFTYADTYITPSSTYAIDIFFEAFKRKMSADQNLNNKVAVIGPSYYALALCARDKELPVVRMINPLNQDGKRAFFPTPEQLATQLPNDTGVLVLTLPNNPNSESYNSDDLRKIYTLAKERGILILLDLVFDQLYFEKSDSKATNPLEIAVDMDMLDQIAVVDGLSKSLNLAGERVGFLATKNRSLERIINAISISRLSNPSLIVEPLLQFEALARIIDKQIREDLPEAGIDFAAIVARERLQGISGVQWLPAVSSSTITDFVVERRSWMKEAMRYYQDNLLIIRELLSKARRQSWTSPDLAAYNTLVGFGKTTKNTGIDKILKLFVLTGVVPMSGQCFGLLCKEDEFLTRITYGGLSREKLIEAMRRLLCFLDLWDELDLGNEQKYPTANTNFPVI